MSPTYSSKHRALSVSKGRALSVSKGRALSLSKAQHATIVTMRKRKHNASMPNVLVRDLPDDVHRALQLKAARRNQSLQQYLSVELRLLAERERISDVLDEVETRRGGRVGLNQAVDDLSEARTQR